MVRRAVSTRMEDHVRGDAKFLGGGDAGDHPADHGGDELPLSQYPRIQSETARRSLPKRRSTGCVVCESPRSNPIRAYNRSIARLFPSLLTFLNTNASRHVQY